MRVQRISPRVLGVTSLLLAAGCVSSRYVYVPQENATASVAGKPAAYYAVPPESPRGDVREATLGIAELKPTNEQGPNLHAMHVRMVVDDNDDTVAWPVDTRDQLGSINGYGESRPAFASAKPYRPPIVTIPPGGSASIDLFYPLPADMQQASEIPQFDLLWNIKTSQGPIAERTSFERLHVEPPPTLYAYDAWWGPGWNGWYDPYWPDYAFWGAPVLGPVYYSYPVTNVAPPARRVR